MSDSEGSCTKGQNAKIKQNDGSGTLTLTSNSMIFNLPVINTLLLFLKKATIMTLFSNSQIVNINIQN